MPAGTVLPLVLSLPRVPGGSGSSLWLSGALWGAFVLPSCPPWQGPPSPAPPMSAARLSTFVPHHAPSLWLGSLVSALFSPWWVPSVFTCLHVCVCVCTCVCMCVHCARACAHLCLHVCALEYIPRVCAHVCLVCMCVYVCSHVCTHVTVCMCVYVCSHVCTRVTVCMCMHVCMPEPVCTCACVCMCVPVFACVCACPSMCVPVCTYVRGVHLCVHAYAYMRVLCVHGCTYVRVPAAPAPASLGDRRCCVCTRDVCGYRECLRC